MLRSAFFVRLLLFICVLAPGAGSRPAVAADATAPLLQKFFSHPDFSEVRLSPSGK